MAIYADRSWAQQDELGAVTDALDDVATAFGLHRADLRVGAGAVVNALEALSQRHGIYLKRPKSTKGGGSVWDFAATACIAREQGAWVSDAHGSPLLLNPTSTTFMNEQGVLYASSKALGDAVLQELERRRL